MLSLLSGLEREATLIRTKRGPLVAWMAPVTMSESLKQDSLRHVSVELCLEWGRV